MSDFQKWEFRREELGGEQKVVWNDLGAKGWELVNVTVDNYGLTFGYFKRSYVGPKAIRGDL